VFNPKPVSSDGEDGGAPFSFYESLFFFFFFFYHKASMPPINI